MKLQHLEGDTGQQMATLDSRTRSIIDDLKNTLSMYQSNSEAEREKMETRLLSNIERISAAKDSLIVRIESSCITGKIFTPDSSFTFCHFCLKVDPQRLLVLVILIHYRIMMKVLQCCGKIMIGGGVFNGVHSICKCKVEG